MMRNFYRNIAMRGFAGSSNSGGESAGGNTGGGNAGGGNEGWFNDGDTHIWISLADGRTSPMLGVCPNGTVTVDWGDGTEPDVLTGTSTSTVKWTPTHNYAKPGDYVITLTVDGQMGVYGSVSTDQYSAILRYSSGGDSRNRVYQGAVRKLEIGSSVTNLGGYALYYCVSLVSVTIPSSVTIFGSQPFGQCSSLASVTIPSSVTTIPANAFAYCVSLASVTIPSSVNNINVRAFDSCRGIRYYDFTKHTAVPTLAHTSAFDGIAADCEIRVPAALYDEWIAATNWTTYASYIVAV